MRFLLVLGLALTLAAAPAPTLTGDPDPVAPGAVMTFSGCGYGSLKDVSVFTYPEGTEDASFFGGTRADASGCFTASGVAPSVPGGYEAEVFYKHGSGVGDYGHSKAVAETEFDVTEGGT
jgi:hypothetical protein